MSHVSSLRNHPSEARVQVRRLDAEEERSAYRAWWLAGAFGISALMWAGIWRAGSALF